MKVVLDTNVLVSGIFWNGPAYQILKMWKKGKIRILLTKEIFEEYVRVFEILSKNIVPLI